MSAAQGRVDVLTPAGTVAVPATLRLVRPLPGLGPGTAYRLEPLDPAGTLFSLRSDDGATRVFVVAPHAYVPGYAPRPAADALPGRPTDPVVLVVLHPAAVRGGTPTVNLLAPVVVDPADGAAVQVVLDEDLPVHAPVGAA